MKIAINLDRCKIEQIVDAFNDLHTEPGYEDIGNAEKIAIMAFERAEMWGDAQQEAWKTTHGNMNIYPKHHEGRQ